MFLPRPSTNTPRHCSRPRPAGIRNLPPALDLVHSLVNANETTLSAAACWAAVDNSFAYAALRKRFAFVAGNGVVISSGYPAPVPGHRSPAARGFAVVVAGRAADPGAVCARLRQACPRVVRWPYRHAPF